MDEETRENLQELSKHIQGVGRMIGSRKPDLNKLTTAKDCLESGARTLAVYIRLEKARIRS